MVHFKSSHLDIFCSLESCHHYFNATAGFPSLMLSKSIYSESGFKQHIVGGVMKILACFLISIAALLPSHARGEEFQLTCGKIPMFAIPAGNIFPAIAGTLVQGSGFFNQFVTVKFADSPFSPEQNVGPNGDIGNCACLCQFMYPRHYYYRDTPIDAENIMTSDRFFDFISFEGLRAHQIYYDNWFFEQPKIIKLTPYSGTNFYAVVAKMVSRIRDNNYSFYAGYEVSNPPVEGDSYVPCSSKTQSDRVLNLPVPGLVQVQLDPANALDSVAFIRLARNTSSDRHILECEP